MKNWQVPVTSDRFVN